MFFKFKTMENLHLQIHPAMFQSLFFFPKYPRHALRRCTSVSFKISCTGRHRCGVGTCLEGWKSEQQGSTNLLKILREWCLRKHHDKMGHSWVSSQIFARFIWALISSTVTKMYKNFQCKAWHLKRFTSLVEFIWSINTSLCQMLSLEPWPFADPFAPGPCKTIEWHRVR